MDDTHTIDLGAASVETKGSTGMPLDEKFGQLAPGLSAE